RELEQVRNQTAVAQRNAAREAADLEAHQKQLSQARTLLAQERAALSARESTLGQARHKDSAARQELDQLARELAELEATLDALRALRQRGQQTYSLVPFKGKRGISRRPIYVECNAAGLIFHPDREAMTGFQLDPAAIRQAVEARLKKLPPAPAGDPQSTP